MRKQTRNPGVKDGNRPHTQNCVAGLFNSEPWTVVAHCWMADALQAGGTNLWFSATTGYNRLLGCRTLLSSTRQDRSCTCVHGGLVCRGHTSSWGVKALQGPEHTAVTKQTHVFLEHGSPGPTPGVREQLRGSTERQDPRVREASPQSRYLQSVLLRSTNERGGVDGRGSLVPR